jgi:hypothetical protein
MHWDVHMAYPDMLVFYILYTWPLAMLCKERQISKHSFHYFKQRCHICRWSNLRKSNAGYFLKKRKLGWEKFNSITRAPNRSIKSTDGLSRSHGKKQSPAPRKAACSRQSSKWRRTVMQRRRRSWSPSFSDVLQPPCIVSIYIYIHQESDFSGQIPDVYVYSDAMQCCIGGRVPTDLVTGGERGAEEVTLPRPFCYKACGNGRCDFCCWSQYTPTLCWDTEAMCNKECHPPTSPPVWQTVWSQPAWIREKELVSRLVMYAGS